MASQSNYFAYNIIDDLYYGTPAEEEMENIYGKIYHRRNEFNNLTPEQQENFDEEEKEFIQAVINKYVTGNNKKISYVGKYDENQNISYTYINPNSYMPIQLSDMISNVNGMHLYKLISAKDIDFDNVILPNSVITRDFNWGIFDEKRRWGNKPIHINNTFELLNVIDYLLCACNNIWNELYKLKYKEDDGTNLWFVTKADSPLMILESKKISGDDFKKEFIGKHEVKLLTTLDPTSFYSTVKTINNGLFGFGTNFHKTETDTNDLYFQYRILNTKASKNIIMGDIEFESLVGQAASQTSQTVNGELYTIYGYKIDDDLKLYPGERIKSFVNESCVIIEPDTIVDNTNKKLKYDTYFRMNQYDTYKEVHIEFLYNYITKTSDNKNLHSTVKHPYILYYINNNDKKQILYVHTLTEEECYSLGSTFNHSKLTSEQEILGELNKHNDYDVTFLFDTINNQLIPDTERFTDTSGFFQKDVNIKFIKESEESTEIKNVPIFYIIPDEYSIEFEVTLPKTNTSKGIVIYYYKNENNIKGDLYITKDKNHIVTSEELNNIENSDVFTKIDKNIDINQNLSLSYCLERYNIPEDYDIYLKLNATYVSKGNNDNDEVNNPLHLKLSDEYKDVALYTDNIHSENIDDTFAQKYYYYDSINSNYKRNFFNYQTAQFFTDNVIKYINYDLKGNTFYHVWEKINNPYQLLYNISTNSLISQETSQTDINNEVNQIKSKITQLSYNLFKFNHILNEDVEQIKFDIDFKIDETSKVKKCQYKYPINLNKIYNLSINYIGKKIIHNEIEHYYNDNKYNYYIDNGSGIQGQQPEYLGQIYNNIGKAKYMSGNTAANPNSGTISYTDVVKELTGNDNLNNLNDQLTYDNTDNNDKTFNITYNQFNKYINLFGSFYTGKKLGFRNNASNYAEIKLGLGNNEHNLETNSTYLFNINGFGKNYRLHGYNNYIYYPNNDYIIELSSYFDVMSVQTSNYQNSINKFLNIKLQEDNGQYQLSYISYLKTGDDDIWTKYDNDFKIGLEETEGDYVIKTIPIDIIKTSYSITLHNMEPNKFDETITYYIPVSYMIINSSTFYPPLNSVPEGEYDLNKETDIAKYQNYVTCWNSDSNYRPITLSLKLFENINNVSPYFYESNEAKMKFNILRSNELINNRVSVDGIQESIFISLDSRHYLSNFIKYTDNSTTGLRFPCGSYMYYDEDKYSYMIKEIYANDWVAGLDEHNIHYSYVNDGFNTNTDLVSNIINKFPSINNKKFLYPIFKKSKDDNDYNYDIYRVSDINKIKFDITSNDCTVLEAKLNDENSNYIEDTCTHTDYNISYIDFLSDDINSFFINNQLGTCILKNKILNNYYSAKNYNSPNSSTIENGQRTAIIIPIYRIKDDSKFGLNESNLYPNTTINGVTYEFFTFIYDDIYLVKKEGQTIQDTGKVLFKKTNENVQDNSEENIPTEKELKEYYEKQLYYFLNYEVEDHQNNTTIEYLLCNKEKLDYLTAEEENEGE